mmetsp:Transcript_35416/g.92178  ORF Transcript_35416/g.92178 Transcript_35416/m.92178 type:complete len:245 (-) Transcript_35416:224-958(-)
MMRKREKEGMSAKGGETEIGIGKEIGMDTEKGKEVATEIAATGEGLPLLKGEAGGIGRDRQAKTGVAAGGKMTARALRGGIVEGGGHPLVKESIAIALAQVTAITAAIAMMTAMRGGERGEEMMIVMEIGVEIGTGRTETEMVKTETETTGGMIVIGKEEGRERNPTAIKREVRRAQSASERVRTRVSRVEVKKRGGREKEKRWMSSKKKEQKKEVKERVSKKSKGEYDCMQASKKRITTRRCV